MKFQVITRGNRQLTRSAYESIDKTSTHRTSVGAARALLNASHRAKTLQENFGRWGSFTLSVNGVELYEQDAHDLHAVIWNAEGDRSWFNPANKIAAFIEAL